MGYYRHQIQLLLGFTVIVMSNGSALAQPDPSAEDLALRRSAALLSHWDRVARGGPHGYLSIPPAAKAGGALWVIRQNGQPTGSIIVEGGIPGRSGSRIHRFAPVASQKFWAALVPSTRFDPLTIANKDHDYFRRVERLMVDPDPSPILLLEPDTGEFPPIFARRTAAGDWIVVPHGSAREHTVRVIEPLRESRDRWTVPRPLLEAFASNDADGWSLLGLGLEGVVLQKGTQLRFGFLDPANPTNPVQFQPDVDRSRLVSRPPNWVQRVSGSVMRSPRMLQPDLFAALAVCSADTWRNPAFGGWKVDPEAWILSL